MPEENKAGSEYESTRTAPDSSEQAKELIKDARQKLKDCADTEDTERAKMKDDLRFCTLDQWPADVRAERENDPENGARPCLTIDKINQYIVQVVNDIRQGRPGIVVRPVDDAADPETAKILKGLIRNIEDQSNAEVAYSGGTEWQTRVGMGYWRVNTRYISPESFNQDIFIDPIPNAFAVYLGEHYNPDGSDARYGFILESMDEATFKQKYPNAKWGGEEFSNDIDSSQLGKWRTESTITVAEYYCLKREDDILYFLADGNTIYKSVYDKWNFQLAPERPPVQDQRPSYREQLWWYKMTGVEVLDKRRLPGKYIPIVKVVGREAIVDGKKVCWGLVRPAKDSLRMYNYFASTITEKMGLAPKAPFIGAKGMFKGVEDKWKKANRINYAYLEYEAMDINGTALPPPKRQEPTPFEAALVNQLQIIEHDVQTSLGIFKAGLGEHEPQQSGRAILALQRESDTGTYHFGANLGLSIRHTGRIILDLIPHYYDTKRIVRIIGEDGTATSATLDPNADAAMKQDGMKQIFNPTLGNYDVTITVGPSYNTKRMEVSAVLTEMVKSQPDLMQIFGDVFFRSLDFPYADVIAERMKRMFPHMQDQDMRQLTEELMQVKERLAGAEEVMASQQEELQSAKQQEAAKIRQLELDAKFKEREQELRRLEAEAKAQLELFIAEQKIALQAMELQAKIEGDVDGAIQKIMSLAQKTLIQIQALFEKERAKEEGKAEAEAEGEEMENEERATEAVASQVAELQKGFTEAVAQIVEGLQAKKTVSMKMPDGRTATATVTQG